jgi:drug/metabolite transporter (DMT)-like permease
MQLRPARVWLAFGTVVAAWGSSYLFIRLAVTSFTPTGMVLTRFGLASLMCAGLAVVRGETFPKGIVALRFVAVGMMMMAGSNSLTGYAQQTVSSGIAGVMHSFSSVWLAALGRFGAFGATVPRTPPRAWWGIGGGVFGVVLFLWPEPAQARAETVGLAALLLATFLFTGATVLQRRTQALSASGLFSQLALQMAGGSGLAGAMSWYFGVTHAPLSSVSVGAMVVLTLFASVAGFAAFAVVLKAWPPARVGTLGVLNPVVAMALGVLALNEPLSVRKVSGALVTLGAVAFVQRVSSR